MPRKKSRYRSNSPHRSDSSTAESSPERYQTKSKRRQRSRSRESESSRRRRRSASRSRRRSRSHSRDRYASKSKKGSPPGTRSKKSSRRSASRTRGRSRSSSRDKYRSSRSSHKHSSRRRSRSSNSRSDSSSSGSYPSSVRNVPKKVNSDDTESKLEKAIKAAEAAGLTMTKLPTYEYKEIPVKVDMPTIHDRNLLQELNSDSFVSKAFVSSRSKKFAENIVIDLDTQTVKIPEVEIKEDDSLLRFNELPTDEELKEMWIKKLFLFRKKMLKGEIL